MTARLRGAGRRLARPFVRRCGLVLGHADGDRGAIAVLAAFLLTVTVTSAALSLDIAGRVAEVRRDQATADLAALDAARNLASAQTLAAASARRNGVDNTKSGNTVTAVLGQLSVVNGRNVFSAGGSNSAVKVTVSTPYNDFLGGLKGHMVASASASTTTGMAGFSVGATLIDINLGLGKFAGASLGLIGYNGLAAGTVTLGALATKLGLSALSPDQVLATNVTVAQIVNASAALLGAASPSYASLTALGTTLGGQARNTANAVQLGSVLGLQSGAGVGLGANVNLMGALSGSVQLANQKAGLSANIVLGIPGLVGASLSVVALVPPTIAYGPVGTTATNTAVAVNLSVDLNIGLAAVHLPITVALGGAVGTLKAIDCTGATPVDIKLGTVFPSLSLNVSGGSITLLGIPLATVAGPITVFSNPVADTVLNFPTNFSNNPVSNQPVSVNSNLSSTVVANLTGSGLVGSLLASLVDALAGVVLPLVTGVLGSLTGALGITIGNADYLGIRPADPTCGGIPKLVI